MGTPLTTAELTPQYSVFTFKHIGGTRLNIAFKWWGRIRQKYDLYSIVILVLVQLISLSYRFANWICVSFVNCLL
jgi:hypothetical protein